MVKIVEKSSNEHLNLIDRILSQIQQVEQLNNNIEQASDYFLYNDPSKKEKIWFKPQIKNHNNNTLKTNELIKDFSNLNIKNGNKKL